MSTFSFFRLASLTLVATLAASATYAQAPLTSATTAPLRPARTPAPVATTEKPASPEEMRQRPSLENGLSGAAPLTNDTSLGRPDESPNGANMAPNGAPRTGGALLPHAQDETAAHNAGKTSEGTRSSSLQGGAEGDNAGASGQDGASGRPVPEGGSLGGLSPFVAILGAGLVGAFLFATLWIRRSKSKR